MSTKTRLAGKLREIGGKLAGKRAGGKVGGKKKGWRESGGKLVGNSRENEAGGKVAGTLLEICQKREMAGKWREIGRKVGECIACLLARPIEDAFLAETLPKPAF